MTHLEDVGRQWTQREIRMIEARRRTVRRRWAYQRFGRLLALTAFVIVAMGVAALIVLIEANL